MSCMKRLYRGLLCAVLMMGGVLSEASDKAVDNAISFDAMPYRNAKIHCDVPRDVHVLKSDFELVDYFTMSSRKGERFALVTIKNTSTGWRVLQHQHLVAVFADCSFVFPEKIDQRFDGSETLSVKLNLGVHRFPLIKVLMAKDVKGL